jgi:hypothetical protein
MPCRSLFLICVLCDIELNGYVLKFFNDPEAEAEEKMRLYRDGIEEG